MTLAAERWGYAVLRKGVRETFVSNLDWLTASDGFLKKAVEEQDKNDSNVQLLRRPEGRRRYQTVVQAVGHLVFLWTREEKRMRSVLHALATAGFRNRRWS